MANFITITASVGLRGTNRATDAAAIQNALNQIQPAMGGANPKLAEDGKCGALTQSAIRAFQQRQFGESDSRVDPGQRTLARLNAILSASGVVESFAASLSAAPTLVDKAEEVRLAAKLWVKQALANLFVARPIYAGTIKPPGVNPFKARVDTHFHLERSGDPVRMIDQIIATFRLMEKALAMAPLFEADATGSTKIAYSFRGGLHVAPGTMSGETGVFNRRKDRIYLCAIFDTLFPKSRTAVVVHELAHFVGGAANSYDQIDDLADELPRFSGWPNKSPHNYEMLTPEEAVHNASSYATYAIHAFYGFDNR